MTKHFSPDFQTAFNGRMRTVGGAPVAVIQPDELGLLGRVLETHCRTYGIRSEEGRSSVAQSLMAHFRGGVVREGELLAILEREDRPLPKHAGQADAAR